MYDYCSPRAAQRSIWGC